MRQTKINMNKVTRIMCETFQLKEKLEDDTGNISAVYLEGVAITFGKPTRNRVSYTYESGADKYQTLIDKPFLDTHNDSSIRTHPPFGHVIGCSLGTNPRNKLPCLFYKVDLDPEETTFIRKAKRGDIYGTSIQVLVDNITEKEDAFGSYIEANIREFLELSAVLIPGDGDTSMILAESFHKMKEELNMYHREGTITPDGIFSRKKVLQDDDDEMPLEPLSMEEPQPGEQINYEPKKPVDINPNDKFIRLVGKRNTEVAYRGCKCPACGQQMLKDTYRDRFQLRCWKCDYRINQK